ncbi:hypothetical protein ACFYO2_03540 [Streptomyces sp. NPDC006602]|uniref:hypothetical protein n=1 Tax=Streptomyces sp. NPDC006602 TaxID=3364751 RepID=UPI0036B5F487
MRSRRFGMPAAPGVRAGVGAGGWLRSPALRGAAAPTRAAPAARLPRSCVWRHDCPQLRLR